MIKKFKIFEAEIYVGTNKHYNQLRPTNVEIVKENPLYDYMCDECFCEFSSYDINQADCSICGSDKLHRKLI